MAAPSLHLPPSPPADLEVLQQRARALAGRTLAELAAAAGQRLPADLGGNKGVVGQLLERWLGAPPSTRAQPDFVHLGIELKTLPVDTAGHPLESTYVSKVPLRDLDTRAWPRSSVYRKLRHVLWVPVQGERQVALAERVVGQAFLWQPSTQEDALLQADWEFHLARIRAGELDAIRGSDGAVLQVRPKASNSQETTHARVPRRGSVRARPAGFYLRTVFTRYLIQRYFHGVEPDLAVAELRRATCP